MRTILDVITPINIAEEREKFFQSSTYNPVFRYKWTITEIREFANKHIRYKKLALAIEKQDIDSLVKEAEIVFKTKIEKEYLKVAQNIISSHPVLPNQSISAKYVIAEFQKALKYFVIPYSISIVPHAGFNFRPVYAKKEI